MCDCVCMCLCVSVCVITLSSTHSVWSVCARARVCVRACVCMSVCVCVHIVTQTLTHLTGERACWCFQVNREPVPRRSQTFWTMLEISDESLSPALVQPSSEFELYNLDLANPPQLTTSIRVSYLQPLRKPDQAKCVTIQKLQMKIVDSFLCTRLECARRQDAQSRNLVWFVVIFSNLYLIFLYALRDLCPSPCSCIKHSIVDAEELPLPSLTLGILDGIRAIIGGGARHWKKHYSTYGFKVAPKLVPGK